MEKGLVQVYYGDGKGKTSAAVGSVIRAVGHGMKCLVYQFLKGGDSGEVSVLRSLDGVTYLENHVHSPFLFNLTDEQMQYYRNLYVREVDSLKAEIFSGKYDMVVLDEAIDAYNLNMLEPDSLYAIMENKPQGTELIITGHRYDGIEIDGILSRADYVTQMKKEKHPFDKGQFARTGIEE